MQRLISRTVKRWRIALDTGLLVAGVIVLKVILDALSWEFIVLSPLSTSIVAGALFVVGLIVAGTLADYKESERMPAEMTAALTNILEDGTSIKETHEKFDLDGLRKALKEVVVAFKQDLPDPRSRTCLAAINGLSRAFLELERLGVPANYIVRLRQEQGTIRKCVLRIYHIQRIQFLPSAYILIQTIVVLVIGALEFTKLDPLYESLVILGFIAYFFIYLLKLIRIIDTPFRVDEKTMDDVSLFLLNEFAQGIRD